MLKSAARALLTVGIVLLLLAIFARLAGPTGANVIGADLAIVASAALVLVAGVYVRRGR